MLKYGILDDFGEVIRWVYEKPTNRQFITIKIKKPKKATPYEIAMRNFEPAPF